MAESPLKIDLDACNGCRLCYDLCPMDVFGWDAGQEKPQIAHPQDCWFCGSCWLECPKRAIDIVYPACFW